MENIKTLKDVITLNNRFKASVNLYLSLNKPDKVLDYVPTKSSISILGEFAKAVLNDKDQATLLIGPYGKGKSHLLLVLLAALSMERSKDNCEVINKLISKIKNVDDIGDSISEDIKRLWEKDRFLPVLITDTTGDLHQAFLYGLNDALKRVGLTDLVPDTYYSIALRRIADWENNYSSTYALFEKEISKYGMSLLEIKADLKMFSKHALNVFKTVYPNVTSGSEFNPMAVSDVLPLYKSTSEKLVEEYHYSGIYIVFDEFSKFIENQVGLTTGLNMKLLQDICELANESKNSQILITMIAHKSIKEYGKYLPQEIINSFTGIEGRIKEKYFITSSKNNYELIKNAIIKQEKEIREIPNYEMLLGKKSLETYYQLPVFRSKFVESEFNKIILKGCFPLTPLSAYLLLNISEKVAQNERTLFTFISNDEPHSMARYVTEHTDEMEWCIGTDLIYDYFSPLFKKEVANEYIHNIWLSAEYAIDRCINEDQKKVIKALAIVLIVNNEDEIPATDKYLKLCINTIDFAQAIESLEKLQFIFKKSSTGCYAFKTRAGSELKSEIKRQREIKGESVNYSKALLDVTGKYYVVPRKYNTIHMMTRYFENQYMNVEEFLNINSAEAFFGDCQGDGKILTLYSFVGIKQEQVKKHLNDLAEPRLVVVCPQKVLKAQKQLKDYEIIQELRTNQTFTTNNEILRKELPLLVEDLTAELEKIISEVFDEDSNTLVYYYIDDKVQSKKIVDEEYVINECCESIFTRTPLINNELVNRSYINTSQTKKTRLNIIQAILSHEDNEDYYSGSSQEATVYRSLFCVTNVAIGQEAENLKHVIEEINNFLDSCSNVKNSMTELIATLTKAPYGMRTGIIPFYLAYVFANRREDIIVSFSDKEIQINAEIVVNMCEKPEDYSVYISKEDLQKEKYIRELNILFQVSENRNLSSNRIKDIFICMQRWFRSLPQVSKNTINLEQYIESKEIIKAMLVLKKALQKIEFNPFENLFVVFPKAFGANSLEETCKVIDDCKTYYDDYFDWVQAQAKNTIIQTWGGRRKRDLYHCLKEWYDKQSKRSKRGLYNGRMTNLMSVIETMDVYDDIEVTKKIVKAVTDTYIEDWNEGALEEFNNNLNALKTEIEAIQDEMMPGEMVLSFTRRNGEMFEKTYTHAGEGTGSVLKNIIEDALDEYDDLSVNDRVSILLEMIERITK